MAPSMLLSTRGILTFGSTVGGSFGILTDHSKSALLPWGEQFQLSLDISGELCLLSCSINSSSSVQISSRTCQR